MVKDMITRVMLVLLIGVMGVFAVSCAPGNDGDVEKPEASVEVEQEVAAMPVKVVPVKTMLFEDKVTVQGTLEARNSAKVSTKIPGTIENIFVKEGDRVIAGKTRLFSVDAEKLENAVKISRQDREVARFAVQEAEAGLEQVEAQLQKTEIDLKRLTSLYEKEVVSKDDLEKVQAGHAQLVASKKYSESVINHVKEMEKQAAVALEIAEKDFNDTVTYAPISGFVAYKLAEVGEMAAPGMPVLIISDTSVLEASAFLPAEYYHRIKVGETIMRLVVAGIEMDNLFVSYKSPTINSKLRTFEVKCVIDNPPDGVVPGAMVEINTVMARRENVGIPMDSIQKRDNKNIVFVVNGENTAEKKEITQGVEQDGMVELLEGAISAGDLVVSHGQSFLEHGQPVQVRGEAE